MSIPTLNNPVTKVEGREYAEGRLCAALGRVARGEEEALGGLAVAIGVWEGSTGERAPVRISRLLRVTTNTAAIQREAAAELRARGGE